MDEKIKLVVNHVDGIQKVIEVYKGGGYFDESRVVWDERIDGPLTDDMLKNIGGLVRTGKSVDFDPDLLAAAQLTEQTRINEKNSKDARISAARQNLVDLRDIVRGGGNLTANQLQSAIKSLVILFLND